MFEIPKKNSYLAKVGLREDVRHQMEMISLSKEKKRATDQQRQEASLTRRRLRWTQRLAAIRPAYVHVRVKRALHVRGANSFRPFRLMPPKGKVSGGEKTTRKERVCEELAFE